MFSSFPIAVFAKNKTVNKITTGIFCYTPFYLNKGQGANIHFMLKLSLAVNFLAEAKRNKRMERIQEYAALFCPPHHQYFFWKINENVKLKSLEYQPESFNLKIYSQGDSLGFKYKLCSLFFHMRSRFF